MARIRIARLLAAVAAVPLALGLMGGVAHAVGDGTIGVSGAAGKASSGVVGQSADGLGLNGGNIGKNQQAAIGEHPSNQSNIANVQGPLFTPIVQSNDHQVLTVNFGGLVG